MSSDPFTAQSPAPATAEEANQRREERVSMVEEAKRVGEAQRRTPALPAQRDMSARALAPEGHPDPEGYISAMIARGGGNRNAPVLDSSKAPAPPVDATILDKCLSPAGFKCSPADLKPGARVFYKGYEIEVEQAVRQGLLVRDLQNGGYALPNKDAQDAREKVAKEAAEWEKQQQAGELEAKRASGDDCDAETQGALDIMAEHVPAQAANSLVNDYVANGSLSEANVVAVAEQLGWTGDQGKAVASKVIAGLQRQADRVAVSSGVASHETNAVWSWLADRYPAEHRNAALALAHANDTKPLRALVKKYVGQNR